MFTVNLSGPMQAIANSTRNLVPTRVLPRHMVAARKKGTQNSWAVVGEYANLEDAKKAFDKMKAADPKGEYDFELWTVTESSR